MLKQVILFLTVTLSCNYKLYAQKENSIWLLRDSIKIDFSDSDPSASKRIHNIGRYAENSSVICDNQGNLLFYSSGEAVWDKNNEVIKNGEDLGGNKSTTQGTVVIQSENYTDIYHIFALENAGTDDGSSLYHSILDMSVNSDQGEVVQLPKEIWSNLTEKLVAIPHPCGGAWLVAHERSNARFVSFYLKSDLLNGEMVISDVGSNHDAKDFSSWAGQMVPSSSGRRIAVLSLSGLCEIFEFNPLTGQVQNALTIYDETSGNNRFYSAAFSPNESKFYLDERGHNPNINRNSSLVTQYNLSSNDATTIRQSREIVGYLDEAQLAKRVNFKVGWDQKIYVAVQDYRTLHRINLPNEDAVDCDFEVNFLALPSPITSVSLPQDLVKAVKKEWFDLPEDTVVCQDDVLAIDLSDVDANIQWDDGTSDRIKTFSDRGTYHILATDANTCEYRDTLQVDFQDPNDSEVDTIICPDQFYLVGEDTIRIAGTYIDTTNATAGCTSKRIYNIDFFASSVDSISIEIPHGQTYAWEDSILAQPGQYVRSFQDKNGCESREVLSLSFRANDPFVPNAFSPNHDEVNDELLVFTDVQDQRQVTKFAVYDRWGQLIYQQLGPLSPAEISWNGKIESSEAPTGVYLYHLEMEGNSASYTFTGAVHLIR